MELLNNIKFFYTIYFTSYLHNLYFKASRESNFALLGISEGLVNAQYTFWLSNTGIIVLIYNKNIQSLFYYNTILFILCLYLYVFSYRKTIYLLKILKSKEANLL